MRVLVAHRFAPGHFRFVIPALLDGGHEVTVLTQSPGEMPGEARRIALAPHREPRPATHPYVQAFERSVLLGQAAYKRAAALAAGGYTPDVILTHAGFGIGLYLRELWPDVPMLGVFEWYFRSVGGDADYLHGGDLPVDDRLRIATLNATTLLELDACDLGVVPARCQFASFPRAHRPRLVVQHEGVDAAAFSRRIDHGAVPLDLPPDRPLVTYAARGLEPYRGFPQFVRALDVLFRRRTDAVAVVVGSDEVHYSARPRRGTWREQVLADNPQLDRSRVHFVDRLPPQAFRALLARSACHVYLSVPFVMSWSLLEVMAMEVPLVGSDTATLREAVDDGVEGRLVDMRAPEALAAAIDATLADPTAARARAADARARVLRDYDRGVCTGRWLELIENMRNARGALGRSVNMVHDAHRQADEVAVGRGAAAVKAHPHEVEPNAIADPIEVA